MWDLIESCLDHFGGGSGSPRMSALAEAMQLVGKVFFSLSVIFLVAPRFRQHHQALIQAMVNMVDVWLMYGTSQADLFRELLESFCVLNVSKYLMEPLSSWCLSQTQREQRQPVLSISIFVSELCTGR